MLATERARNHEQEMARTRRNDVAVKLGADVVKMARHLAVDRNVALAEYLTERLRPLVVKDFDEMTKRLKKPEATPKPPKTEK
jgi:hypothetical protein